MQSNDPIVKEDFCSPYNLKMFIDLYNSQGIVFRGSRVSSKLTQYKKKQASVFFVFSDTYKLPSGGKFFKIPKSDSVLYFHNGNSWDFFPKEVSFSKRRMKINSTLMETTSGQRFILCLSIENARGYFSGGRLCFLFSNRQRCRGRD